MKQLSLEVKFGDGDYNDDTVAELTIDVGETIDRPALAAIAARAASGFAADVDKYLRTVATAASLKDAIAQIHGATQQQSAVPPATERPASPPVPPRDRDVEADVEHRAEVLAGKADE